MNQDNLNRIATAYPLWRIHHNAGTYTAIRTGPRPPRTPGTRTVLESSTPTGLEYRIRAQETLYRRRTTG